MIGSSGTANGSFTMMTLRSLSPCTSMPCQKLRGAEEHGIFRGAEAIEQNLPRRLLALHEQRVAERFKLRLQTVRGVDEHLVAGEEHKRPAVGLLEVVDDLLARPPD